MEDHLKLIYFGLFFCCASAYGYICRLEEEECGYRCYDPSKSDCLDEGRICDKGKLGCGNRHQDPCYSPDTQDCVNNEYPCPKGHLTCKYRWETQCYDPTTHNCTESGAICSPGEDGCGENCYSRDEETCHSSEGWNTLCKNDQLICGKENCYDPTNSTCHSIELLGRDHKFLCKIGQLSCGYECYSAESGKECLNDGWTLCESGEKTCGYKCYDVNTQTCINESLLCEFGQLSCGNYTCYSPHNETCFEDRPGYPPTKCPIDHSPCGYSCYDPQTQVCLGYGYGKVAIACPIGSNLCGVACYDPLSDEKKCWNADRGTFCDKGEVACGMTCYIPGPGVTCDATYSQVCENGEKSCLWSGSCYNPETHKCMLLN